MVTIIRQGYTAKQGQYIFNLNLQEQFETVEHKEVEETINKFFDMFNVEVKTSSLFIKSDKREVEKKDTEKGKPENAKKLTKSDVVGLLQKKKESTQVQDTPGGHPHTHIKWSTLAAIPKPKERMYAILHYLPTVFNIDDYANYFVKRDFPEDRVENRKTDAGIVEYEHRMRNQFYHDTKDLLEEKPPKIEEILTDGCSTKPKKYRVIDYPVKRDDYLLGKLIEENRVRLDG